MGYADELAARIALQEENRKKAQIEFKEYNKRQDVQAAQKRQERLIERENELTDRWMSGFKKAAKKWK